VIPSGACTGTPGTNEGLGSAQHIDERRAPRGTKNKNGRSRASPNQKKTSALSRVAAVTLSVVSALGGALLESATKVIQTHISPYVEQAACWATDLATPNPNATKFTMLVARFQNDPEDKIRKKVGASLRRQHPVNVLETCRSVDIDSEGDPVANANRVRATLKALLETKQADIVVYGLVRDTGVVELASTYRGVVNYSMDRDVHWKDSLKSDDIENYFGKIEFRRRMFEAANDHEARFVSCPNPLYGICSAGNLRDAVTWMQSLLDVYDDRPVAQASLFYDRIGNSEYGRLALRIASTSYFAKRSDPTLRTPTKDHDYWFLSRYFIERANDAFKYLQPNGFNASVMRSWCWSLEARLRHVAALMPSRQTRFVKLLPWREGLDLA
jgi:hypothetical protein